MKKWLNSIGLLCFCFIFTFTLFGCSSSNNVEDNVNTNESENAENSDLPQSVNKTDLGISMELTGEYSDCEVSDLSSEELATFGDQVLGGFSIKKDIDGTVYTLSNVAVVNNESLSTSEIRSQYPYIYSGSEYSIVATLPLIDNSDSDVYDTVMSLQTGVIQQLCTIFFDEESLGSGSATTSSDTNTNIENDVTVTDEEVIDNNAVSEDETIPE